MGEEVAVVERDCTEQGLMMGKGKGRRRRKKKTKHLACHLKPIGINRVSPWF